MVGRRVCDLEFGELKVHYGKNKSYTWEVEDVVLSFPTTRQVSSQVKFREFYLEETGEALMRIPTETWISILNKALSTTTHYTTKELEDIWLRKAAEYFVEMTSDDQEDIARGKVYHTNTGMLFTTHGFMRYFRSFKETKMFQRSWHHEKLLSLLNAKSSSVTLKDFQGRAAKLNNFSCRVDNRFTEYYEERLNNEVTA